jgi:DNA-binding LytR/AlgR family response regulator
MPLGVREAELWAIEAEDHYVRLILADGRAPLLSGRFGDALAQVAHIDGCRIHRGRWVADAAVCRVERDGRSWSAVLPDGRRLPISASHVGSVRERGWTGRRG